MEPANKRVRVSLEPHLEKRIYETTPSGREFVVSEPSISEKFSQQLKQHNSNYEKLLRIQAQERIDQNIAFKELQSFSFFPKNIDKQELKTILLAIQNFPPHLESVLLEYIDKYSSEEYHSENFDSQREENKSSIQENQQSSAPWNFILENLFHARAEVETILALIYFLQQSNSNSSNSNSSIASVLPSSSASSNGSGNSSSTNSNTNSMNQAILATSNVTKTNPTISGFHADLAIRYLSKHQELKKASESLYDARDRIASIISRESTYFEELQTIRNYGWTLANKPFSTANNNPSSFVNTRSSGISGTTGKPVGKLFLDLSLKPAGSKHPFDVEIYELIQDSTSMKQWIESVHHSSSSSSSLLETSESKLGISSKLIGFRINSMSDIFASGNSSSDSTIGMNVTPISNDKSNEGVNILECVCDILDISDYKFHDKKNKSSGLLDKLESTQLSLFIWEIFKQITEEVIDSNLTFLTASNTSGSVSSATPISSTNSSSHMSSSDSLEINRKLIESRVELKSSTHVNIHLDHYSSKDKKGPLSLKLKKMESSNLLETSSNMEISESRNSNSKSILFSHGINNSPSIQIDISTPSYFHPLHSNLLSILLFQSARRIHKLNLLSIGNKISSQTSSTTSTEFTKWEETILDKVIIGSEHSHLCAEIDKQMQSISSVLPNSFFHWNIHYISSSSQRISTFSRPFVSNFIFQFGKRLVLDVTVLHTKIIVQKNTSIGNIEKWTHNHSQKKTNIDPSKHRSFSSLHYSTYNNSSELWNITPAELGNYLLSQVASHLIDSICDEAAFTSSILKDTLHFHRDNLCVELFNSWRSVTVEAIVLNYGIQLVITDKPISSNLHKRASHLPTRTYTISLIKKESPLSEFSAIDDWIDRLLAVVIHSKFQ